MSRLLNSPEYPELERQLSENNARFTDLRKPVRLLAVYLHRAGMLGTVKELWSLFYRRPLPTIGDFLAEKYLGDMSSKIFPVWCAALTKHFAPGSAKNEIVFGGAIGTGKTSTAMVGTYYNFHRINLMLRPQAVLGAPSNTLLVAALFSITLDKASLALIQPFKSLLLNEGYPGGSEYVEVRKETEFVEAESQGLVPFVQRSGTLYFPNNVIANAGSQVSHTLSFALISAFLDEAEFVPGSAGLEKVFQIYSNLKERVRSRFLGSPFTFLTLVSSAKYSHGIIADYTKKLKDDDPYTSYYHYPIWECRDFNIASKGHFYVLRGTTSHPSKILDEREYEAYEAETYRLPPNCEVIRVPSHYRGSFEERIEEGLRNIAGVQTIGEEKPFDDLERLESAVLVPEFRIQATLGDEQPLFDKLPRTLFKRSMDGITLARHPTLARYCHLDLAETAEAGFTVCHKELDKKTGRVLYVYDIVCWIDSPTRIDLQAIMQLILDLGEKVNVGFHTLTADQFQSAMMRQMLEANHAARNVDLLSVDRTVQPYLFFSSLVNNGQVKTGRAPKLKRQLLDVSIDESKSAQKIYTRTRKDIADSAVGSANNAAANLGDAPTVYFDEDESLVKKKAELMGFGPRLA